MLLDIFETMTRIRLFDDKAQTLIGSAQAFFVHYPVRGHEIISASVAAAIEPTDYMTATYRGLADEVAKGVPLRELWGEMLGKATGTLEGPWRPDAHLGTRPMGLMLCTGIVGGGIPVATGLGLASALKGDDRVTICNFGDGATNIGAFHESLNMASVWNLPVVFVCQNNQYGEHTKFADTQKTRRWSTGPPAYGMKGIKVDGMDPAATYAGCRSRPSPTPAAARGPCCSSASRSARSATCSATRTSTWTPRCWPPRWPPTRCRASASGCSTTASRRGDAVRHRGAGPGRDRRRLRAGGRRSARRPGDRDR